MTTHDLFLEHWNSQRPLHTNSFEQGLHRGSREQALASRFIETTARAARNCLVLDLDHEQADWRIRTLAYDDGAITCRDSTYRRATCGDSSYRETTCRDPTSGGA